MDTGTQVTSLADLIHMATHGMSSVLAAHLLTPNRPWFETGSRVYGFPRPDSDTDVVIKVSKEEMDEICETCKVERVTDHIHRYSGSSVVFGFDGTDYIFLSEQWEYDAWLEGKRRLLTEAPGRHPKEYCQQVHEELWQTAFRAQLGLQTPEPGFPF